jgi:small multidrug resistance pump
MTKQYLIAWICLFLAIVTEVAGTTAMKMSHGFAYLLPSLFIFVFYFLSLSFLALSLKQMEIGFAYATWSGLGTMLIYCIGIFMFYEPVTIVKTLSVGAIIVGVMGLMQA